MRMRLLYATDLSARSAPALQRAALLAQSMNADVMSVHAVSDAQAGRTLRTKMNRAKLRLMNQAERAMPRAPGELTSVVRLGKPLQVISSVAREWEPDLIVMAAPRRRRLEDILGGAAERLIVAARTPVLVVSHSADAPYERVVLASDLSSTSAHAARAAANMKMFVNSSMWAVHAFDPAYPGLIAADERIRRLFDEQTSQRRLELQSELLGQLEAAGIDRSRLQASVQAAEPVRAIQGVVERVRPDLLVIGVSRWAALKRMLIGSVANQLLQSIACDVLAIPSPDSRKSLRRAA